MVVCGCVSDKKEAIGFEDWWVSSESMLDMYCDSTSRRLDFKAFENRVSVS